MKGNTQQNPQQHTHWHALESGAVLSALQTTQQGLTSEQAEARLQKFGPNLLKPAKPRSPLIRFAAQFRNVLIYVLLAAALLTFALQHWIDCGVILAVVLVNALIGFIQEGKAEASLAAIRKMLSFTARVCRETQWLELPTEQLVPGDIVALQPGDKVPADLRLLSAKNLMIDEAMLTGESVPVAKHTAAGKPEQIIAERKNMAYSGTLVTYGVGTGVVAATAEQTEIGRISELLAHVQPMTTPLLKQMVRFGRQLTFVILLLGALTIVFGVSVHQYAVSDMLLAAVGLSVAAIPEGLPAIMTITMAIGVQRMVKRNAIIRRLPCVETLGALTTICSDKTGTLTRNEMTVQALATASRRYDISGVGYRPIGDILHEDQPVSVPQDPVLQETCRAVLLCNDASLYQINQGEKKTWTVQGDPTEIALLTLAVKAGMDLHYEKEAFPRSDVIPFDSEHQLMASLHHDHSGHGFIYVKGAPERILELCHTQRSGGDDCLLNRTHWQAIIEDYAKQGLRLLAIATKPTLNMHCELTFHDIEGGLSLLGIVGMMDPPRTEAILAVEKCHRAGIRVKMITGDHALTAVAVARQLNIGDGQTVLTGADIDQMDAQQLQTRVTDVDVFARTSPEHKLNLLKALQANNDICAMTGDGVNDAPALRRADVGIAMGNKGTEVAKDASEMVLIDDNFASIADAIEEGRTVYDNLRKSILFILPTNGGEALTIVAAILLNQILPITAAQILWVNMITAVTLALAFAFEPSKPNVMNRQPRKASEALLSLRLFWRVAFVSLIIVAGTFGIFLWYLEQGASIDYARTAAVNTLVLYEIFYLFNARQMTTSSFSVSAFMATRTVWIAIPILLVFQLLFTYAMPMQFLFSTEALRLSTWMLIVPVTASVFFLVELEKGVMRWWGA